jgi:spore germination protein GerM
MTQLLLGVSPAEDAAGLTSMFSTYTAGTLRGVRIADGVATVDFTSGFAATNNFSTSNASAIVYAQIDATLFHFPEIVGIEFEIDGERWCGWENTCDGAPVPLRARQ